MNKKQKVLLESKLMVFRVCYHQAESQNDHKRMDQIEIFIDELLEEINQLD